MTKLLGFPEEVNDTSARIVAAGAVSLAVLYAATGWGWVLIPLTYGFIARVASGPRFSPLGQLATKVITPRLTGINHRILPGPPCLRGMQRYLCPTRTPNAVCVTGILYATR